MLLAAVSRCLQIVLQPDREALYVTAQQLMSPFSNAQIDAAFRYLWQMRVCRRTKKGNCNAVLHNRFGYRACNGFEVNLTLFERQYPPKLVEEVTEFAEFIDSCLADDVNKQKIFWSTVFVVVAALSE